MSERKMHQNSQMLQTSQDPQNHQEAQKPQIPQNPQNLQTNHDPKKVVLVDDDLVVREVVKIFLSKLQSTSFKVSGRNKSKNFEVYTSSNGLEGLGLAVAVSPDLVVIDSTLPKYSGKDLIDFIISNSKFRRHESKVVVIYQDEKPEGLPSNCVFLSKEEKDFFEKLLLEIQRGLEYDSSDEYYDDKQLVENTLAVKLGKLAGKYSNKSAQIEQVSKSLGLDTEEKIQKLSNPEFSARQKNDSAHKFLHNANKKDIKYSHPKFLRRIYLNIVSGLMKSLAVIFLFMMYIVSGGRVKDENIKQTRQDRRNLRAKYYPPVLVTLIILVNFWIQIVLLASGGFVLFDIRFKSVFAVQDLDTRVAVDLEDSLYDTNKMEFVDGSFVLKNEPPEDEGQSAEEIEEKLEEDFNIEIPEEQIIDGETDETQDTTQPTEDSTIDQDSETDTQDQIEEQDSGQEETQEDPQSEDAKTDSGSTESPGEEETQESTVEESTPQDTEGVLGESTEQETTQSTETQQETNSEDSDSTQNQDNSQTQDVETQQINYYSDSPSIIFNQEIEYSELLNLLEDSNFNDLDTSVEEFDEEFQYDLNNNISYQLSPDKEVWYYFSDDDMWEETEAESVSSNIVQKVNKHLDEYEEQVGGGVLYLKAFLNSDGETQVKLNRLIVERDIKLVDSLTRKQDISDIAGDRDVSGPRDTLERNTLDSTDPYIDDMTPVLLNVAGYGTDKVIGGKVEFSGDGEISSEDVGNYLVQVYYTSSTDPDVAATSVDDLIGEASLEKITKNGEPQYVFDVRETSSGDGYVTARVKRVFQDESEEYSILSFPVNLQYRNTFTVVETGDQSDALPGDEACDWDTSTPGFQCTLRAAMEESVYPFTETGDIQFDIPSSDPGCLSFVDNGGSGYNPDASEVSCLDASADPDISWWRISPVTEYPDISEDIYITGSSQPGYAENTNSYPETLNGQPVVEIECGGLQYCLNIVGESADVLVRGLVLNSANNSNIISSGTEMGGPWIGACYIGTDISGNKIKGLTNYGLEIFDGDGYLSGSSESLRNIIVGSKSSVFLDTSSWYASFESKGSLIGVLNDGSVVDSESAIWIGNYSFADLGDFFWEDPGKNILGGGDLYGSVYFNNVTDVAYLYSKGNIIKNGKNGIITEDPSGRSSVDLIDTEIFNHTEDGVNIGSGGEGEIVGNKIYNNGDNGIELLGDASYSITNNTFYDNGGLAIDLGGDGVTLNDSGDSDTGPNSLQNYPYIDNVVTSGDVTSIDYQLTNQPGYYLAEFYYNETPDPSGYGEGSVFLCSEIVYAEGSLPYDSFSIDCDGSSFENAPAEIGGYITSTVTSCEDSSCGASDMSDTSEFSEASPVGGLPIVNSTGDGGDTNPGDDTCYSGNNNSEGNAECTLRAAIEETNGTYSNYDDIEFNIPESDPGCLSFTDNGGEGYDPDASEVHCLDPTADPDIKWWRISPSTDLPHVDSDRHIMASTQSGYVENTNDYPEYLNGQPVIEVTCSGLERCLTSEGYGADVLLDGLVINSAIRSNLYSYNNFASGNLVLSSCYVGTDISGLRVRGSTDYGLELDGGAVGIIGDDDFGSRNIVLGGVAPVYSGATGTSNWLFAWKSFLGRLKDGSVVLSDSGILAENSYIAIILEEMVISGGDLNGGIYIKDTVPSGSGLYIDNSTFNYNRHGLLLEGNVTTGMYYTYPQVKDSIIHDNIENGVTIIGDENNVALSNNSFYNNGGLGIDLGGDGVTANDIYDSDTGPNGLQNYPYIDNAFTEDETTTIRYDLFSSEGYYLVEFYYSASKDSSDFGEGKEFLCSEILYHSDSLYVSSYLQCDSSVFGNVPAPRGYFISGTATKCDDSSCSQSLLQSTSEFSSSMIVGGTPVVNSTGDGSDETTVNDSACYTGLTNSEGESECTLRAAIEVTNEENSYGEIEFDIPESDPGCLSFVDNGGSGYDPDASEVNCLDPTADPDIKWWRISPATELPYIESDVYIFGNTQSGYIPTTSVPPDPMNGQYAIEVSCSDLSKCIVVSEDSSDIILKGVAVNSAIDSNIQVLNSPSGGGLLWDTFIGTDISGTKFRGDTLYGIDIYDGYINMGAISPDGVLPEYRSLVVGSLAAVKLDSPEESTSSSEFGAEACSLGVLNDGTIVNSEAVIMMDSESEISIEQSTLAGGNTYGGVYVKDGVSQDWSGFEVENSLIYSNINGFNFAGVPTSEWDRASAKILSNTIRDNTNKGILVTGTGENVSISQNSIHSNGDLGIDLGDDGVTANDAGDADTGPNNLQNYPELQNVVSGEESTEIEYSLDAESGHYRVEFFYNLATDPTSYGEGETYMCHTDIEHTGGGSETYTVECDNQDFDNAPAPPGTYLTSTVLLCEDSSCSKFMDTSEFSEAEVVKGPPIVNSSGTVGDESPGDEICDTGNLNVNGVPECTLQAAIDEANVTDIYSEIHFNIPANDPSHYCYEDDEVAGQITLGNKTSTTAHDDAGCGGTSIDPDYPHSWFGIPGTTYSFNDNIEIKGYTQTGSNKNTVEMGEELDNSIKIEITDAEFNMNAAGSGVEGIALSTGSNKISMNAKNGEIQGIFMGVDVSGTEAVGSNHQIRITEESNLIGSDRNGTSDSGEINVLNGNNSQDATILLSDDAADNTVVANNYINTGRSGKENSGNFGSHYAVSLHAPIGNNFDNVNISENVLANNIVAIYAADGGHEIDNLKIEDNKFKVSWDGLSDLNNDISSKTESEVPSCVYAFNSELRIKNNIFKNCGERYTSSVNGTAVLSMDTLDDTHIESNQVIGDKIQIIGDSSNPASNLTITENSFESSKAESLSVKNISESQIIENIFSELCTQTTAATVVLEDSDSNKIKKNKLGLNYGGSPTANNCSVGFWIKGTSENNWVGGSLAEGNTISGYQNSTPYQDAYAIYDESSYDEDDEAAGLNSYTYNNLGVFGTELLSANAGGIYVSRKANLVGNNIAGHQGHAIKLAGDSSSDSDAATTFEAESASVKFNCIGTASDCTQPISSPGGGIFIEGEIQNLSIENNTIANLEDTDYGAVTITGNQASGVTISDNKIYNTTNLPIDLVGGEEDSYGVTSNDENDSDTGPNNLQNHPVITDIEYFSGGFYKIHGDLESNNNEEPYDIEICISEDHPSSHGGCIETIGKTQASSPWNMLFKLEGNDGTEEIYFSALATNNNGSSSEFSETALADEDSIIRYEIELIYPVGGMQLVDTTPQLDWNPAKHEDRVYQYVDHYEVFIDGEFYTTVQADKTELQITQPLTLGEHRWEVVAYQSDNFEIGRSSVETFEIVEDLCSFENLYPVDVSIDDQTPKFDWSENCAESGVDKYYIYVDGEKFVEIDGDTTDYQTQNNESLSFGTHEWYVVALKLSEEGLFGEYGAWEEISKTEVTSFEIVEYPDYLPESGEDSEKTSNVRDFVNRVAEQTGSSLFYNSAVVILGSLGIIAMSGVSLLELPAIFSLSLTNLFVLVGGMKKGTKWGTVFDAITKKPIRYVFVKLFDEDGKLVERTVTDSAGRFYFRSQKRGKFKISVKHPKYDFPSRIILDKKDQVYGNIYRGGWYNFEKQDGREMIGVPLDPIEKDQVEKNLVENDPVGKDPDKKSKGLSESEIDIWLQRIKYYSKIILIATNPVLLSLGIFANGYMFITERNFINLVLGVVHTGLLAMYGWGIVRKKDLDILD